MAVFPQASVAVHVLTTVYDPAQLPCVFTSLKINATSPAQLSVAVGVANSGVAGQFIVDGAGNSEITGSRLSLTVIVCDTLEVFAHASVNVQVLMTVNAFAQVPGVTTSTPCTVIGAEQLSVAVSEIIAGKSSAQATVTSAGA